MYSDRIAKPSVWWDNDGKKYVCGRGHPSPHPIPLEAFGASIIAPLALATQRRGSPLFYSPKILNLYYAHAARICALHSDAQ